jgi:RNAse (barnase) inhibitor barstar
MIAFITTIHTDAVTEFEQLHTIEESLSKKIDLGRPTISICFHQISWQSTEEMKNQLQQLYLNIEGLLEEAEKSKNNLHNIVVQQ